MTDTPTNDDQTTERAETADYAHEADTLDGYHAEGIIQEALIRLREADTDHDEADE